MTVGACVLLAFSASAQAVEEEGTGGAGLPVFRPTTGGPLVSSTALLTPPGRLLAQSFISYGRAHAVYDALSQELPADPAAFNAFFAATLYAEYGVVHDVAVGAQLALTHVLEQLGQDRQEGFGVSDTLLFVRHSLFRETPGLLPEVALVGQVLWPTAASWPVVAGAEAGEGSSVELTVGLQGTKGVRPILLHADALVTLVTPRGQDTNPTPALAWSAAAEWPFWSERLAILGELSGYHHLRPDLPVSTPSPPTRPRPGAGPVSAALTSRGSGLSALTPRSVQALTLTAGVQAIFSEDIQLVAAFQRTLWGQNVEALDVWTVTLVPVVF